MQDSLELEAPSSWKPWVIASIASLVILGVALGIMQALGLFKIPTDDTGAKTIAAALALVGTIFATVVTLVGTIVKYSIDERNARREVFKARRAHALAMEAEQRNRIEAAIRAVGLLGENNKDATPHQIGGAILALVSLNELELAVSLLAELWPAGLASHDIAHVVLRKAFKSSSPSVATSAAATLFSNAEKISHKKNLNIWPVDGTGWNVDLPNNARLGLVMSAVTWMKMELSKDRVLLPQAVRVLFGALEDPDVGIQCIAVASLRPLTEAFPQEAWLEYTDDSRVSITNIAERLTAIPEISFTNYAETAAREIQEALAQTRNEP